MARCPETMGPGRSQVLGPGQEEDELRINTDPPVDMNLGCREGGRDFLDAPWSLGENEVGRERREEMVTRERGSGP